jgi:hypothetical protein
MLMVVVVIVAVLSWAAPVVVPDVASRWRACRNAADRHAAEAARWTGLAAARRAQYAGLTNMEDVRNGEKRAQGMESMADRYQRLSWKYRRALFIPWDFYVYGDRLRSGQLR